MEHKNFNSRHREKLFLPPFFADLDGDGSLEIVATTLDGYVYAWKNDGSVLFSVATSSFKAGSVQPIQASPLAVDLDGDGQLEIISTQGTQLTVVNASGNQISDSSRRYLVHELFSGSPAVSDIDNDGRLDIISGGTYTAGDQGVVYRWRYGSSSTNGSNYRYARRQFREPVAASTVDTSGIQDFVTRFYEEVLNRTPDQGGLDNWVSDLATGTRKGADVALGFVFSTEFINRNTTNEDYVTILYSAFFGRTADQAGYDGWISQLSAGGSREDVLNGFIYALEFANLAASYGITAY